MDNNNCECLLKKVMALKFTLYDLSLYLDTHPFDQDALCLYQDLVSKTKKAVEEYEENCGPLTMESAADECEWKWIKNPWPWERRCD